MDVVIDTGEKLIAVEMKSGQTIASDFFRSLDTWSRLTGSARARSWLVYGGSERQSRPQAEVLPWRDIDQLVQAAAA